jgi:hypothetical protein
MNPRGKLNSPASAITAMLMTFSFLVVSKASENEAEAKVAKAEMKPASDFLIDDFSKKDGVASIGTRWRRFTDQVMGGVSEANHVFEVIEKRRCIRLRGDVSLENRGGFIQVALLLDPKGRPFDASPFRGVRLLVRGNGESYYVHLRTSSTILPWQYYSASFVAGEKWTKVELPFEKFKPENLKTDLEPSKLTRLAIVAAKKAFSADVSAAQLEFYR